MEWKTEITKVVPNSIRIKGYPIEALMANLSFGEGVFLLFKGELPTKEEGRMMNALLIATMDHSVTAPSACATRFVASGGSPIQSAVAAGIQALGSHHGGAIEEAQSLLEEGVRQARESGKSLHDIALEIAKAHKASKKRLPGFGHPYHKKDPRTVALFKLADELNFSGDHIKICQEFGNVTEEAFGRNLVINADAGMAAVLADMGFPVELARGFFIISRSAGLVAHAFEEYTKEKPFRAVSTDDVKYMGPDDRDF